MGYILLWLIGIPIPILILIALLHHWGGQRKSARPLGRALHRRYSPPSTLQPLLGAELQSLPQHSRRRRISGPFLRTRLSRLRFVVVTGQDAVAWSAVRGRAAHGSAPASPPVACADGFAQLYQWSFAL